jgi:cytochrome c
MIRPDRYRTARAFLGICLVLPAPAALAEGDPARGREAFKRCYACHTATAAEARRGHGLSLFGVVGRKAASVRGYDYSPALRGRADLIWDEAAIDRFIADPAKAVPGTAMTFALADPRERADVIAYLKSRPAR